MANKYARQFRYIYEQDTYTLFAYVTITGSSGAVSTFKGAGVASITKAGTAGQYVITLAESYGHFLSLHPEVVFATPSAVAAIQMLATPATMQSSIKSSKQITVQCLDFAGAAVNPEAASSLRFEITMRNSSNGPND